MTQKFVFLIGYPVGHSLSPKLHNPAFRALGMDWRYDLLETPPDQLARAVERIRRDDCAGANVTIPHKQAIMALLDELGESARRVGAVNTIVKQDGRLIGENTDTMGFARSLVEAGVSPRRARTVILGAGGAARAVALAVAEGEPERIDILNRTPARAVAIAHMLQEHYPQIPVRVNAPVALKDAEFIVNATSVGMTPNSNASPMPGGYAFPRDCVAVDLVYRPAETRFLQAARAAGAQAVGGIGMLIYQGAAAFKLWTGRDAPPAGLAEVE